MTTDATTARACLAQIRPAALEYDEWLAVGMAAKDAGLDLSEWDRWSARDTKRYNPKEMAAKWASFKGGNGRAVGVGTLVKMARDRGGSLPRREDHAVGWDGKPVPTTEDPKTILADPPLNRYDGKADLVSYLRALFKPGDAVGYVTEPKWDERRQVWAPTRGTFTRTAGDLLTVLEAPDATIETALGPCNPEVGAWIRFNPLDGKGITDQNVTAFRFALVEADKQPVEDQYRLVAKLRLPVAALVSSAGKSVHAIVRVEASNLEEYASRVELLYTACAAAGLKVDRGNRNPSRLSRMPGVIRRGRPQRLLATGLGCASWAEWLTTLAPATPSAADQPAQGIADAAVQDPVQAAKRGHPLPCTDLGNSERFAFRAVQILRHVTNVGWRRWDGRRWALDPEAKAASEAAKAAVRAILREAAQIDGDAHPDLRKALVHWSLTSESRKSITAAVDLARSHPALSAEVAEFDLDPWLFCCANGTLDLRTGELRPHRREDMVTRMSPVVYDPRATSDLWARFLEHSTGGDTALEQFLARAVGYSLTGDVSEEKLFFVHGPAASGKSTFIEAVKTVMGDYGLTADFDMLLKRKQAGGIRNDLARLAGARFVASVEVDEGKELAEGIVKSLTGNDTVSARHLYREFFDFQPQFKLWLAANHAPAVNSDDLAMWRRILRVPFENVVPKERRDPRIKAALRSTTDGGPAILTWAMQGCLEWQGHGLGVPTSVEVATEAYRHDCDSLAGFFDERCRFETGVWEESSNLRAEYERWADANHVQPKYRVSPRTFAEKLKLRGCTTGTAGHGNARVWHGVELVTGGHFDGTANTCEHMRAPLTETSHEGTVKGEFTQIALASARIRSPEAENGTSQAPQDAYSEVEF